MNMSLSRRKGFIAVTGVMLLAIGCQTPDGRPDNTSTGALAGGAFGALTGALIGGVSHRAGLGAAIGGLSGVLAGGMIGHSIDREQRSYLFSRAPETLQ